LIIPPLHEAYSVRLLYHEAIQWYTSKTAVQQRSPALHQTF